MSPKLRFFLSIIMLLFISGKVNAQLQIVSVTAKDVSCHGGNDGEITMVVTGGNSPFKYTLFRLSPSPQWVDVIESPDATVTFPGSIPITAGNYIIAVDDGTDALNFPIDVYQPTALTASITPNPAQTCSGSDLQLNGNPNGGTGGYTHLWTGTGAINLNSTTIVNPVFNSTTGGTFDLTYRVTDENGCFAQNNATVNNTDDPVADAGTGGIACGNSFTLNATNSFGTGTWTASGPGTASFSNINDPNATVTVSDLGPYTFTWTETNNGCSDSDNVIVNFFPETILSLNITNPSTSGSTDGVIEASVAGGTSPFNFILTDSSNNETSSGFSGATSFVFSNLGEDDYTIEVVDNNGCNDIQTVILSATPILTVDVQTSPACSGIDGSISIDITSGQAPFTITVTQVPGGVVFNTTSSDLNYLISGQSAGDYDVSVQDDATNNFDTSVTIDPGVTATISYDGSPFCGDGFATVTQTGQGGGTYSASPAGLVIDPNTGTIDLTASSSGTYTVTYNFSDGVCSGSAQTTVEIGDLGTVTISYENDPYCAEGTATVTIDGLTMDYTEVTYSSGHIPTDGLWPLDLDDSRCPGTIVVTIPTGVVITGVDVQYNMTALGSVLSYIADQRSQLRVVSPGGLSEAEISEGPEDVFSVGTHTYIRNGLNIANGVVGGGNIVFELHAGRTFSGTAGTSCATNRQRVDNNTWRVRVYHTAVNNFYAEPAGLVIDPITGEVDLEASTPGTYTVYYEYGDGTCVGTTTTQITINPLPVATIAYEDSPYCATGTATVTRTGQAGGTYSADAGLDIDPVTGEIDLENSDPGTYIVTYTFSDGTCEGSTTAEVVINDLPEATISYPDSPYCATGTANVTRTGQVGGTYSASPAGLSLNPSTGAINLAASTPGVYTVTYTFTDGICDNVTITQVEVLAIPTASISYDDIPYCAFGIATVTLSGQTGGTFTSTAGLVIDANTGDINLTASLPDTYTVTYSFTDGTCSSFTTAEITINALPQATISYDGSPYCAEGIATVTRTGQPGGTYNAEPAGLIISEITGEINLAASIPGTYTVYYRFTDGICENITSTTVVVNALPEATISYPGTPFCAEGVADVVITGQTGGTFASTAGLNINSATGQINLESSTPGTYTVTYTFSNSNCTNITTTEVTINALPVATISYPLSPYCPENTAVVTRTGQAGGTYSSSAGLVIDPVTGEIDLEASTPGIYTVTYEFSDGICDNFTSTQITIRELPVATISYPDSPYCATDVANVTLTGQPGGTFISQAGLSINPVTGQIDLAASTPGNYVVTYTFSDGFCSNTATTNIEILALPTASISYDEEYYCAFGFADVTLIGQTGGTFSSTEGLVIDPATGQIDLEESTSGIYTITYTFSDGNCDNTATAEIDIRALPQATISYPEAEFCPTGIVDVTIEGQTGGVFNADPPGLDLDLTTGAIDLENSVPGDYIVYYRFDDGDCENLTSTTITINALPVATIIYDNDPYCATGFATPTITGQTGGTFSSTPGLVINAATGEIDLANSTPDTYIVTYEFTDGICTNTATTTITINPLPIATISYEDTPYCAVGVAAVTRTGQEGGTYSSTSGLVIDPATGQVDLVASDPGTYTVTYEFTDGTCSNTTTTQITINALPIASISYDDVPYCASGIAQVTLTGQTGGTFTSTPGLAIDPVSGDIDLEASTPGSYVVTYTFSDGTCDNITTTTIEINALPEATISYDEDYYCAFGFADVTLSGQTGGTFSSTEGLVIDPVTGDVDLELSLSGTYTVTYTFSDGTCTNSATAEITLRALPTAQIEYEDSPYCGTGTAVVTLTGQEGGIFNALPVGLSLGLTTGTINLDTSIPGTYTVYYRFDDGFCENLTTTTVIINEAPLLILDNFTDALCAGEDSGTITVQAIGGQLPYTFELLDADGVTVLQSFESTTSDPFTFENIPYGLFYVQVSDGNICSSSIIGPVFIDEPDPITIDPASVVITPISCIGLDDGSISIAAQGGSGNLYFTLLRDGTGIAGPQTNNGTFEDLEPGIYVVSITDDANCGPVLSDEYNIIDAEPFVFNIITDDIICAGDEASISVSVTGGVEPYEISLWLEGVLVQGPFMADDGELVTFAGITQSGNYLVTATDVNNCADLADVVLAAPVQFTTYIVTGGGAYCDESEGIEIGLSGSDAGVNYQLFLDGVEVDGALIAGNGDPISFGLVTLEGIYTIMAIDIATSCEAMMNGEAIVIINPIPLVFEITGGGSYCQGDVGVEIGLNDSEAGINYQLLLNDADTGIEIPGTGDPISFGLQTEEGTYTILAINPGTLCSVIMEGNVDVVINISPIAVITGPEEICLGDEVTLVASGGESYLWSNGETTSEITVSPAETITYTLTATNACGDDETSLTIVVNTGPFVDLGEDIEVCEGVPVILDAGALADVSYLWSDGSTDQTLEVTQSGIYSVIVTDNNTFCFTEDLIEVVINPAPLALTGDDQIICLGEDVTLGVEIFDPVPANTFLWTSDPEDPSLVDTDISNPIVSPLVTTVYTLTETYTETGCFTTNSVTITVVGSSPNAGEDQTICAGTEIVLGPAIPIEGNVFTWSSSNPEEVFETDVPNPAVTPLLTTTYTLVEEYTEFGCVNTSSVTITVNPAPLAETGPDLDICPGDVVTLGATLGGGPIPLNTYLWTSEPNDESMSDPTISTITVSPSQTTTYTLVETYVSTGCTTERSVVVTVHDFPPALVISDASLCENSEINLGSDSASDDFNYVWSSEPAGFTSSDKNPMLVPSDYTLDANNEITFFLEVSSQYCASQNQVTLTIIPAPIVLIADDTGFCSAEEARNLNLGGDEIPGYTYLWESDADDEFTSTEANPVVSPLATTTYTVTVINTANGCAASESVTISISDLAFANLLNPEICEGETAVALGENIAVSGGMEPYQYFWTDADGISVANILNPIVTAPFSGHYNLSVTDAMNCPISGQVQVSIIESPEVYLAINNDSIRGNVSIYIGQSITFQALPANYQLYEFYIIDAPEEDDTVEFEPGIEPVPGRLVQSGSSNAYTAFDLKNGQQIYVVAFDGRCSGESTRATVIVNELPNAFTPDGDGINDIFAEGLEITIFNRWGQKVYQGARSSSGWDGNYNGRKVSPGTYYYLLNIYDEDNKKTTLKGSVTVILSDFK
jgi:gliding motility-associated-like protein